MTCWIRRAWLRTITWAVKSLAPCGLVLGVGGDISTLDILGRDVLGVEFDIVAILMHPNQTFSTRLTF